MAGGVVAPTREALRALINDAGQGVGQRCAGSLARFVVRVGALGRPGGLRIRHGLQIAIGVVRVSDHGATVFGEARQLARRGVIAERQRPSFGIGDLLQGVVRDGAGAVCGPGGVTQRLDETAPVGDRCEAALLIVRFDLIFVGRVGGADVISAAVHRHAQPLGHIRIAHPGGAGEIEPLDASIRPVHYRFA